MTIESSSAVDAKPSSPLLVLLAWAVVGIPALWGIFMTGRAAMQLFQNTPTTTTSPAAPGPASAK